jgi:hypothetical protein
MTAKYIFGVASAVFLIAALWRTRSAAGRPHPQTRTWLLVAMIFAAVSGWLFARG